MRRFALLSVFLVLTSAAFLLSAPLTAAFEPLSYHSTSIQVTIGGILDQIDSWLNSLIDPLDSLFPEQSTTPSVNISSVKAVDTGQSSTAPQVIVALQNGKVALDAVKIDVSYKNSASASVLSNSAVIGLKAEETRSITFKPQGLSPGSYAVGVVVYKNGTDPSKKATPPYDVQQNAATLIIAKASSGTGGGTAKDEGIQISNVLDIVNQLGPWMYFIIAMTALITVALFFVFSQNRSGEDRFEDDHFKEDYHSAADKGVSTPSTFGDTSPTVSHRSDASSKSPSRQSRKIEVTAPEPSEEARLMKTKDQKSLTEHTLQFDSDGFVVGDATSQKTLRNKVRGKKGP